MMKPSPDRVSPMSVKDHEDFLANAIHAGDVDPQDVARHYLHLVFKRNGCNVSETARKLGMHRRSLQRILDKKVYL